MEKLYYKEFKGLQVFCQKCRSIITLNTKPTNKCNHPIDRQIYKANLIVPNTGGKRRTLNLKSKKYDDAIIELLEFKNQIEHPELYSQEIDEKPETLVSCVLMYLDFVQDVGVHQHQKKHTSKKYIKDVTSQLKAFIDFIKTNIDKDIENYKIKNINNIIVGKYCEYLDSKKYSIYTYRSKIKALRTMYNYLIVEKSYDIENVWKKVKLKSPKPTNVSIVAKDFYALLNVISPNDSIQIVGKSNKNRYRPWLKNFIKLKAYTGLRNEEVASLKWNMIKFEDNIPLYVESPNLKVNRQKNNFNTNEFEYVYIPVGEELFDVLNDLDLNRNKYSDKYITEPNSIDRKTIAKQASRSFTFYWLKLNNNEKRSLKDLRKTYATSERIYNNSNLTTLHSNVSTTEKHYINNIDIVKEMVKNNFRIFPKQ